MKNLLEVFHPSCALFPLEFRPLRRAKRGFAPLPHRLLKKAGENFKLLLNTNLSPRGHNLSIFCPYRVMELLSSPDCTSRFAAGLTRRVMGNPRRGFPIEKPLRGFSPLLRFISIRISPFAKGETGLCPVTPPPFEKGGRKL